MAMEKFDRKQLTHLPGITIRRNGTISLNDLAAEEFRMKEKTHVALFFDAEENTIGIRPTNSKADPRAFMISREKGGTLTISCQSFLAHCGIPYKQGSKNGVAIWDAKQEMILVKVP